MCCHNKLREIEKREREREKRREGEIVNLENGRETKRKREGERKRERERKSEKIWHSNCVAITN